MMGFIGTELGEVGHEAEYLVLKLRLGFYHPILLSTALPRSSFRAGVRKAMIWKIKLANSSNEVQVNIRGTAVHN